MFQGFLRLVTPVCWCLVGVVGIRGQLVLPSGFLSESFMEALPVTNAFGRPVTLALFLSRLHLIEMNR